VLPRDVGFFQITRAIGFTMAAVSDPLRLVIVEDENLFRDLLGIALRQHPNLQVVASFGDADIARAEIPQLEPDIVLLDIDLGAGASGVHLGLALREVLPKLGVVLLSNHQDIEFVASLGSRTLAGWSYLLKKSVRNTEVLLRAIQGAHDGLTVLDPQLVGAERINQTSPVARLTLRQRELLRLIAQGMSNSAIATALDLSLKTIENNINSLYQALNLPALEGQHSRVKAVLLYLESMRGG
jgi:DNA-binding NarL/FixJ family response regulator